MKRPGLAAVLLLLGAVAFGGSSRAASSWKVRSFPAGSGRWCATTPYQSFVVLGRFPQASVWETIDAGHSGSFHQPGLPIPADSVTSFSIAAACYAIVTQRGQFMLSWSLGQRWEEIDPADSVGTPSVVYGMGSTVWIGTREGALFSVDPDSVGQSWREWIRPGSSGLRQIQARTQNRIVALFEDGRILVQDTVWVEPTLRASHLAIMSTDLGYALEQGTKDLWKTTDGGQTWEMVSAALAAPDLAPWCERARKLLLDASGIGVLPCGDVLLATNDEGLTWRIACSGEGMFLDAAMDDLGDILTVGARIYNSTDEAQSFEQMVGGDFGRVQMGSANTLWALDHGLLLSLDGGLRWFRQPLPDRSERLQRIAVRGDYEIWLHFDGPDGSRSYRSTDRGGSYETLDPQGMLHGVSDWSIPEPEIAWAWTNETIMRSTDHGRDWQTVRDRLDRVQCLAANDSLHAIVRSATSVYLTSDGGSSWTEGPTPPEAPFRALAYSGAQGEVVGVSDGIYAWDPACCAHPWARAAEIAAGDTLYDVAFAPDGSGWAVGTSGLLLGSTDSGHSWDEYRLDLEMNAIDTTLVAIHLLDPGHGVTGRGSRLIRLLPDLSGPIFRMGVSVNPHLPRYLDIHVTARERLRGDSLSVTVDGEVAPSALFDSAGFLYRVHYELPAQPAERILRVSGYDWAGNRRSEMRLLVTAVLDAAGSALGSWGGGSLRFRGETHDVVALLGLDGETPEVPAEWNPVGAPFQAAGGSGGTLMPTDANVRLACFRGGKWTILEEGPASVEGNAVLCLLRTVQPVGPRTPREFLRVFPVPNAGACTIAWDGPGAGPLRWELIDVTGRRRSSGELAAYTMRTWTWRALDEHGAPLPAGVYWLRVQEGPTQAVRRLLIAR